MRDKILFGVAVGLTGLVLLLLLFSGPLLGKAADLVPRSGYGYGYYYGK